MTDMVSLAPALIPDYLTSAMQRTLHMADLHDDMALRELAPADILHFEWSNDPGSFLGLRETFTGKAGPTFPLSHLSSPLDVFLKIWDEPLIEFIVAKTNKYAAAMIGSIGPLQKHSRLSTWTPTDRNEILRFLAILQFHSLAPAPVQKDYFKISGYLSMPEVACLMPYNRFLLLKKFIHFSDSPPHGLSKQERKLYNIKPIIDRLTVKFRSLYMPSQSIAVDESLLMWNGRLSFAQKISTKADNVGIKSFELWESSTGYLWNFLIFGGVQTDRQIIEETEMDPLVDSKLDGDTEVHGLTMPNGATAKVVYDLAKPLLNLGHTLVIDNNYNCPLLARFLKREKTDVLGTLRVNREFVPDSIKSLAKSDLRVGEVAYSNANDMTVLLWRDANLTSVISTYHKVEAAPKEKYGKIRIKPQAILDYNVLMGGIDKKDQLLSAYPMERSRNQVWYKKLFMRLLNVSILNAYILYKSKFNITHRKFRINLAEELIAISRPTTTLVTEVQMTTHRTGNERPRLTGNHFIMKGKSRHHTCVWCRMQHQKKTRTTYRCEQCNVALCILSCFKEYHTT